MVPEAQDTLYKLGLASLGASEDELKQLAAVYWYTFEAGLCMDNEGKRKILGGAILTSCDESAFAMSDRAKIIDLDLEVVTSKFINSIQYSGFQPFYVLSPPLPEMCKMLD